MLQKQVRAEEANSRDLIARLNATKAGAPTPSASLNSSLNRRAAPSGADAEALPALLGDLAGLTVLRVGEDAKGSWYDCLVTDVLKRGLGVSALDEMVVGTR